jgi:hypothetical protein
MRRAIIAATLAAFVVGCALLGGSPATPGAPGLPPDASVAQVTADEILQAVDVAWNATASVCLLAEQGGSLAKGSCAKVLLPAEQAISAAASGVDAWSRASAGDFPCAIADAVASLQIVESMLLNAHIAVPSELMSAVSLAGDFAQCPASVAPAGDAGGG